MINDQARQTLQDLRRGLNWVLGILTGGAGGSQSEEFVLRAEPLGAAAAPVTRKLKPAKPVRKAVKKKKR
jgi:hypothetical protein